MIKKVVRKLLRAAGWELRRLDGVSRATMKNSLRWLRTHDFEVGTVLDVGASNGCWSEQCMRFFPDASYVLFEPQPVHAESLDAFARKSRQRVFVEKKAVGSAQGQTFFAVSDDPFGGALASHGQDEKTISVACTTIDAAVSELAVSGPFLLKLDTHGFERSILAGAAETLARASVLIIEAYNYRITDEAPLFWELCALLAEKGFRPVDLVDVMHRLHDRSLWQMDIVFVRADWKGFDYVQYR